MPLQILTGDCRAVLPTLEAGSVQCCISSPPYYGLRDYGTAQWEGGEAGCEHIAKQPKRGNPTYNNGQTPKGYASTLQAWGDRDVSTVYHEACPKCGARRIDSQLGLEQTPEEYIANMVAVFREVWRVLRDDGTCWVNMGDSYASNPASGGQQSAVLTGGEHKRTPQLNGYRRPLGLKPKDLCMMPARVALALQADGWYLRSDIIWHKPNPMPESVTDRPTKAHEYIFLLTKAERYFYDAEAIREPQIEPDRGDNGIECRGFTGNSGGLTSGRNSTLRGMDQNGAKRVYNPNGRNKRSVWTIATQPYSDVTLDVGGADYVGCDGKPYKASADCPIHAHLANRRSQQMAEGGEQLDRHDLRNLDIDARRAAKLIGGYAAMLSRTNGKIAEGNICERNPGSTLGNKTCNGHQSESLTSDAEKPLRTNHTESLSTLPVCNSDFSQTDNEGSAILNNNQNRRTVHVFETNSPCNVSAGKISRIDDKPKSPEMPELFDHMPWSSTLLTDSDVRPLAQKQPDILNKPSLRDNICQCKEYSQSHFATFPEEIPKLCILAGSKPGDTILDPFAGSGTVGQVALELGRRAILIELNPAYIEMARDRTYVTPGFF